MTAVACAVVPTPAEAAELVACARSFRRWLCHWQYVRRETGEVGSFARLWAGQDELSRLMEREPWLFVLKAGKLGFSELECAYDGWRLRFGQPNARVHLFSRSGQAARELLAWVRFGLDHLPPYMRLPTLEDEAGSDTSVGLKLRAGPDDTRTVVSYASTPNVAIDQTATHSHVDEFARMPWGDRTWQAVETTVSPAGGTVHIVTRGAGPNFAAAMWQDAIAGRSKLRAFFAPYDQRPGRDDVWYAAEASSLTQAGIWQYAPRTWQEAIQGDASYVYPQFDTPAGRHIVPADPCQLAECRRAAVGLDPGAVNPTAMVLLGERTSGRCHQYAEFYRPGVGIDEIEQTLAEWAGWAGQPLRVFVPGDEKTMAATLGAHGQAHGWTAHPAMREINTGIQLVTERLNTDGYTVHAGCRYTIDEFRDYRNSLVTDRLTRVEYAGDRPIKHHADAMDALRYGIAGLAAWEADPVPVRTPGGRVYYGR
ncbi:MAG: hypothetical protein KGK07_12850 [Chloroflexota bacterium]|nr:hypothetical protein [Chloroflexota bacterium]